MNAEEAQEQLDRLKDTLGLDNDGNPPPLDPEFEPYITERDSGLTMIEHPLYHTLYTPIQNGHINKAIRLKQEEAEKAVKTRNWYALLFVLYERPYRLTTFRRYMQLMTDKEYWGLLGDIWTDSENIFQHVGEWRGLLSSQRKRRFEMMDEDDLAVYRDLPDEFEVFRGTSATDGMGCGMAWTMSYSKALWFAKRLVIGNDKPRVYKAMCRKHNAIAYFDGRSEQEIVVFPENVYDLETLDV